MNIFITGANGFIGQVLCKHLQKKGYTVFAGMRKAQPFAEIPIIEYGDLANACNIPHDFCPDIVIHCAARAHKIKDSSKNPKQTFHAVNVLGLRHVIQAVMKKWDTAAKFMEKAPPRFILLSSIKVLGEKTLNKPFTETDPYNPQDDYAWSKAEAEQVLLQAAQEYAFKATIIRPPLVYGENAQGNIKRLKTLIRKRIPLPFASIKNKRSMIQVENICAFIEQCVKNHTINGIFHVADKQYSTAEFIRYLAREEQIQPILFPCSVKILKWLGKVLNKETEINRLCESLQVDCTKAQNIPRDFA
ncbi:MAG TPA: NAD-dependent epimerase/dehydratase family protein [Gammaproteobacteria bacterium]|nr:NAD-dependent epimerase/dehydratase family protein [Gammaproteobacteria bacterium]